MNQHPESSHSAIQAIAAVLPLPTPPFPFGYDDADEVRELRASAWVDIGVTDPAEVARWTNAGVHSAVVAATITTRPVSRAVNNVRTLDRRDPALIEPITV